MPSAICSDGLSQHLLPLVFDQRNIITVKWEPEALVSSCLPSSSSLSKNVFSVRLPVVPSAHEVPAAAAEVPGVPGGRQSSGGSAGAPGRADTPQVQHRSHPRTQRVRLRV